jgi:uncharacterized protein (TIGR02145 family)
MINPDGFIFPIFTGNTGTLLTYHLDGFAGNFQTSMEVNDTDAYYMYVMGEKNLIGLDSSAPKTMGYSVRCIKISK